MKKIIPQSLQLLWFAIIIVLAVLYLYFAEVSLQIIGQHNLAILFLFLFLIAAYGYNFFMDFRSMRIFKKEPFEKYHALPKGMWIITYSLLWLLSAILILMFMFGTVRYNIGIILLTYFNIGLYKMAYINPNRIVYDRFVLHLRDVDRFELVNRFWAKGLNIWIQGKSYFIRCDAPFIREHIVDALKNRP